MGIIQSTINQALGMAAIATKLSPTLEAKAKTRAELYKLEKQEEALKGRRDAAVESIDERKKKGDFSLKNMQQEVDILQETASDVEQLRKKQFELKPSPESYEKYIKSKGVVRESRLIGQDLQSAQDLLAERQQQAMQQVASKQDAQLKQKRNFKEYLKQQPIAGGGTVGQLSDKAISQIAKQYSPAQRKKLMNTMDKEKMNKDGK